MNIHLVINTYNVIAIIIYAFFGLLCSTEAGKVINWPFFSSPLARAVFGPLVIAIFGLLVMLAGAILASPLLLFLYSRFYAF